MNFLFWFVEKCVDLQTVNAGTVNMYTDGVTSYAAVSCVDNYYVNGVDLLTCNVDGSWDNQLPTCGEIYFNVLFCQSWQIVAFLKTLTFFR